ncbi:MAG: NAD-dependent protein deacylase [Synergistaceae bacterium]|nr:NAD-dependent protein deacylase [Synergistaceae bacterium]
MPENRKRLVVLTGAGISAESGFQTFRDSGGLWEKYNVEDVASIEGWYRNSKLMTDFYNDMRKQLETAQPNEGHKVLAELEEHFDVRIITQNVDNLHEKAGSSHVLHLHGELTKARPVNDDRESKIIDIGYRPLAYGEKNSDGEELRPHIVWFGEAVPAITEAANLVRSADIFAVVGSSLVVYPAAGLVHDLRGGTRAYLIDPKQVDVPGWLKFRVIREPASTGCAVMRDELLRDFA